MSGLRHVALNALVFALTTAAVWLGVRRLGESQRTPGSTRGHDVRRVANWEDFVGRGPRLGPDSAAITIVEFSDFLCPYCRVAAVELDEVQRALPGKVAIEFRNLPSGPKGLAVALAAWCAHEQGRFESLHERLFADPDSVGRRQWSTIAEDAGVADTVSFLECMSAASTLAAIRRDSSDALALGVRGTPTLLIREELVLGAPGLAALGRMVTRSLAK
ncbi:MAG: DsbA family protein [Gemmatimonadetes bacterium]|nr:DsbA family protein [Gemmatimonadota bacterium]